MARSHGAGGRGRGPHSAHFLSTASPSGTCRAPQTGGGTWTQTPEDPREAPPRQAQKRGTLPEAGTREGKGGGVCEQPQWRPRRTWEPAGQLGQYLSQLCGAPGCLS